MIAVVLVGDAVSERIVSNAWKTESVNVRNQRTIVATILGIKTQETVMGKSIHKALQGCKEY